MRIAILWDFDGVIVFTPHEEAWRLTTLKYGISGFTSEFYHRFVSGRPRYEGARAILEILGRIKQFDEKSHLGMVYEFAEEKNRIFNELISRGVYSVNYEVLEFIQKTRHYSMETVFIHVIASASKNVAFLAKKIIVNEIPIQRFFDIDVSGLSSTKKGVFEEGIRAVGEADCYIVIDDAPSGIKAAVELGLIPVGFKNRDLIEFGAVITVESFKDLEPEVFVELCKQKSK